MATYNPPAPWSGPYPVAVVDDDTGLNWEAYGPNQLKKPAVVLEQAEDCCLYSTEVTDLLVAGTPWTPSAFAPPGKSDGDTYLVCHPNGFSINLCVGGQWVNQWQKIFDAKICAPDAAELEAVLRCHYETDGVVTGSQVDAWLDQNLEFSDSAITEFTNPCCNTVRGSNNSSADGCSSVEQGNNSEALGLRTVVEAAGSVSIDTASRFTVASGNSNDIDHAWYSHVSGNNNEVGLNGNRSTSDLVAGVSNDVAIEANTAGNIVTGAGNDVAATAGEGQAIYNAISGTNNIIHSAAGNEVSGTLNEVYHSQYNHVSGGENLVDGITANISFNQVSGWRNQLINEQVNGNAVSGAGNVLDGLNRPVFWNIVGGQQNFIDSTITAGATTANAVGNNLVVGVSNIVRGTRGMTAGQANCNDESDNLLVGVNNEFLNGRAGIMTGWGNTVDVVGGLWDSGYTTGHSVRKVNPNTDVTGFNQPGVAPGKGTGLSSNRTYEKGHQSGNINISGTLTTGFAFPDFGEYAVVDRDIEQGLFLVYEGLHKARIAEEGEDFDGVSRAEIPISAGGGIDPDNNPWLVDEFGSRQRGDIEYEAPELVIDEEATEKAIVDAVADLQKQTLAAYEDDLALVEKRNKAVQDAVDKANAEDAVSIEPELEELPEKPAAITRDDVFVAPVMKEVMTKQVLKDGYLANPDFDAEQHAKIKTCGVSMLGRVFVQVDGDVEVGNYLAVGKGGKAVVSKERTRARVLAVEGGNAYVVIK